MWCRVNISRRRKRVASARARRRTSPGDGLGGVSQRQQRAVHQGMPAGRQEVTLRRLRTLLCRPPQPCVPMHFDCRPSTIEVQAMPDRCSHEQRVKCGSSVWYPESPSLLSHICLSHSAGLTVLHKHSCLAPVSFQRCCMLASMMYHIINTHPNYLRTGIGTKKAQKRR